MAQPGPGKPNDPRIRTDAARLRQLGAQAHALSLLPRQPARSVLNGRHASRLRGRGLNFEELRDYLPGDDVRSIDWKVTARTGTPHVRVYTEERDRPAFVLVDQRQAMFFGSRVYMKSVIAAEAAAIVAHRVLAQGDRIGGIVFGDAALAEHKPQRRPLALNRLLNSIADANALLGPEHRPESTVTLNQVLQETVRMVGNNALVLVVSDFDGLNDRTEALLRRIAAANDLILFNVADPTSVALPDNLRMAVSDGDLQADLDTSDTARRTRLQTALRNRLDDLHTWSRRYGFPLLPLTTEIPALDQLLQLFGHPGGRA